LIAGLVGVVGLSASASWAGASDYEPPLGSDPVSDRGILELPVGADIQTIVSRYGFTLLDSIPSRNIHLVSFLSQMTEEAFELLFLGDPEIDHSELNFETGDSGPSTQSTFLNVAPVEFQMQPLWGSLGLDTAHQVSTGSGTTIAVIDTGLDASHAFFAGRVHLAGISFVGAPGDTQDAGNGVNDDNEGGVDEMVGHGTWVAGLALAVAPDSLIMPIRALNDEGFSDAFTVTKAVYHAIDHGADVINMSLGSVAQVRIVERAVDDASDLGIVVVASGGNQGVPLLEFPAGNNKAMGVTAVDLNGVLAPFANFGDRLLLAAPGIDVIGPVPGGFGESSGTSAAAPLAAGAAALLIERGLVRRADDFRAFAKDTAVDIRDQNPGIDRDLLGEGMLDLAALAAWPGPCFADLDDNDTLDLADVQAFVRSFTGLTPDGEPGEDVDYVEPRGVWDLADVQFFLQAFLQGCP